MLKYEIQLTDNEIKLEEITKQDWREKYLSPNLSFVSGVTSQSYHLEKYKFIQASNPLVHTSDTLLPIQSENVTRQGYVLISGKTYPIESGTTYDYNINDKIDYKYVFVNGKYFYVNKNEIILTNWLKVSNNENNEIVEQDYPITVDSGATEISADTIVWIEDGHVTIDGVTYKYNRDMNGLTLYDDTQTLATSAITNCTDMTFSSYTNPNDCKKVTKFIITKNEEINELFDSISYISRYYYINYKNHYINVIIENKNFVCNVPNYLLSNETSTGVTPKKVLTVVPTNSTEESGTRIVTGDTFDVLYDLYCFVEIDENRYVVNHEIMNSNNGNEIAIYLTNQTHNIVNMDTVKLVDSSPNRMYYEIQNDANNKYVIFNGEKYFVKSNICDKVKIGDEEYFIDYINGKTDGEDCIVRIGDDRIPMEIVSVSGQTKLQQYGLVVNDVSSATSPTYDIVSYSGITIDETSYLVEQYGSGSGITEVVYIDRPNEYMFTVKEVIGSSMLLCEPRLSDNDFSEEEIRNQSQTICNNVVLNQRELALFVKNKIFGDREITDKLAFNATSTPSSSDDYFNLFDNLSLYTSNGYIHIPLSLTSQKGGNPLLDNIIERDFFEYEKNKAINPIIDMEKDVYYPKTIETENGKYHGSETVFGDIDEIRVNLHFRTRNSESWKVNEKYNDVSQSDGWFVTDYDPYKGFSDKDTLMKTSDLMGLLNFTNNDVFYQKSKISKSFLRFSFYDSFNQQNQNLLATSTVFMDEHKMFKTYIDNSRKGINIYKRVNNPANVLSKISVDAEWYGNARQDYFMVDDNHRIGSEFIIKSKYETDTSSEGYYIYMHKEYSEGLKPKQIFMKIEFNHAGVGRTIPFIVPMKWGEKDGDDYFKYPESALTLSSNAQELKKGIALEDSYAQMYIPLYAVYDFKHKEYAYVFDSRYVNVKTDENSGKRIAMLNLFEIKYSDGTQENNKVARINFNTRQFEEATPTCS